MSRWFRFYDDAINDPKILKLSDNLYRFWVGILCISSKNEGKLPVVEDIAIMLRMKPEKVRAALEHLVNSGLLDEFETTLMPHNWDKRQFKSDVSTERVKRFRNAERNVSETPPDTDTDTDTEQKENTRSVELASDWPSDWFDQFWSQYPRREEKKKARAILDRLRKSNLPWATLYGGVCRYAAACREKEPRFIKQPPSWLNAGCWDDEFPGQPKSKFDIGEYLS